MKSASAIMRWALSLGMMLAGLGLAITPAWAQGTPVDTQPITLAAGRDTTISVKAFCIEYGKPFPTNFPTVATTAANPQVVQILRYAISKGYTESEPYQVQLAIWRQTTGEWKATDRTRAEEIFNNASQAPAAPQVTGVSLSQAAAANNIQIAAQSWAPQAPAPEQRPWLGVGQLRLTNNGTADVTVNVPVGVIVDAPTAEQDMVMYVTSVQAQATSTPAATATTAATATVAATATTAATSTPAATATSAATATTVATAQPAATSTPVTTLPTTGGDTPGGQSWLMLLGAVLFIAGLGMAVYNRGTARA